MCILCFDVRFQVVRMADYLSRSHPPFSPSSLSSHSPQRSTCRCLTYKHRIRHYILKCCSIFHSTLILLSKLYILVIWYYGFQCRWLPFVLSMSSLFDVVAAMTYTWYLSFFLHWQNFWRIKFTPKKRVNYDKIQSKLPIFCVITAKYTVNCQFFALNL